MSLHLSTFVLAKDATVAKEATVNAGFLAGAKDATVAKEVAVDAQLVRKFPFLDFWSAPADLITVPAAAANLDFPDIVVAGIPVGATLKRVVLILTCRALRDTSGANNYIDQASKTLRVKKSTGAWGTDDLVGITFDLNSLYCVASNKEGGPVIIGNADVKVEVDGDATYNVQSNQDNRADAISALANNLELYDVQVGLRLFYS